jgi:diguanylate cyclase (GGDEF)-like protein
MKPIGPLPKMTMAVVALCGMLVLLADLLFGVFPDRAAEQFKLRKQVGEALAVQVATLLGQGDSVALQKILDDVARRTPGVRSLALRRADGKIFVASGPHDKAWRADIAGGASTLDRIEVPMMANGDRWGGFEMAYLAANGNAVMRWLTEPLVVTMLFLSAAGMVVFSLYMRRALQHLDPASVIPDRVQGAFDAMAEGVVVLDVRGRLLLANKGFRALNPQAAQIATGQPLSSQAWLTNGLGAHAATHPWMRSISERATLSDITVEISTGEDPHPQQLEISSVPITDAGGRVRGALATFSDVSQLHRANTALREAMAELTNSREQIQRQNVELKRLATRDPLTGCLNRRAFTEQYEVIFNGARSTAMPLCCLVLDIDFFKRVNDTYGHSVGDRVIQEVAKKLTESARASDLVCRYGGEEFAVVLPGMDKRGALALAERIRRRIERDCGRGVRDVQGLKVTVSIGVAMLMPEVATSLELIDLADQALYRAKRDGRNRIELHSPDAAAAADPAVPA